MARQLHDSGEEFITRLIFDEDLTKPADVSIGLHNDATYGLSDSDDLDALQGEPAGALYARQTAAFGTDISSAVDGDGNWVSDIADQTFDVSDSDQTVDSYFVVVNYQRRSEGASSDHLFFTGMLDQSTDLSQINGDITVQDCGLSLD